MKNMVNKEEEPSPHQKRKFACVECRQQKSKCDAMDRAPLPCTKCQRKNIKCILKRDFKRTYKRARNEVIERTFKQLTKNDGKLDLNNIESIWDNNNFTKDKIKKPDFFQKIINLKIENDNEEGLTHVGNNETQPIHNEHDIDNPILTDDDLKCTPKSLGDIYMSSEDILILFKEFAHNYHHFLPIVDLKKGPELIYTLSPCLFWVILLTGLRRCDIILNKYKDQNILNQLSHLVKTILAEITISPIIRYTPNENDEPLLNVASVYSVQAFLIYTFWPPLTSSLSADTSWNTIGTAMFQALRVGLNSADFSKEYATANWDLINEQRRTWICCNIVSQIIASSMGFPPYVSFDHSVLLNEQIQISLPLRQMIQIAHFENQIIKTMNSNQMDPSGMVPPNERFPLLQVLSQQLSQLEFQLNKTTRLYQMENGSFDDIRKFLLYVAKVHLLTYYFVLAKDENEQNLFETKRGLVKVYNNAINLLFHTRDMFEKDPDCIKYFPGCFILNIWQSACIVTKLVHSSISNIIDCQRGKEAYNIAIQLTLKASILKYDMAYRSSGIMRSIWSLFNNMHKDWLLEEKKILKKKPSKRQTETTTTTTDSPLQQNNVIIPTSKEFNLSITVNSRMSVSVFFDCLYVLKSKCGMAKLKRESGGLKQENDEEEDEEEEEELESINNNNNNEGNMKLARNTTTTNNNNSSSESISDGIIKDPEGRARRLIERIPLDPNPINADISNPNSLTNSRASSITTMKTHLNTRTHTNSSGFINGGSTNGSEVTTVQSPLSVENMTNVYTNLDILDPSSNLTSPMNNLDSGSKTLTLFPKNEPSSNKSIGINTPISQSNPEKGHAAAAAYNSMTQNDEPTLTDPSLIQNEIEESNLVSLDDPTIPPPGSSSNNTVGNGVSPNSMIANFDNWDSEMVWKDVDILMNEFAFNPTV